MASDILTGLLGLLAGGLSGYGTTKSSLSEAAAKKSEAEAERASRKDLLTTELGARAKEAEANRLSDRENTLLRLQAEHDNLAATLKQRQQEAEGAQGVDRRRYMLAAEQAQKELELKAKELDLAKSQFKFEKDFKLGKYDATGAEYDKQRSEFATKIVNTLLSKPGRVDPTELKNTAQSLLNAFFPTREAAALADLKGRAGGYLAPSHAPTNVPFGTNFTIPGETKQGISLPDLLGVGSTSPSPMTAPISELVNAFTGNRPGTPAGNDFLFGPGSAESAINFGSRVLPALTGAAATEEVSPLVSRPSYISNQLGYTPNAPSPGDIASELFGATNIESSAPLIARPSYIKKQKPEAEKAALNSLLDILYPETSPVFGARDTTRIPTLKTLR